METNFKALIAELDLMKSDGVKDQPVPKPSDKGDDKADVDGKADDKKVVAASKDDDDDDKDGEPFGKAFKVTLPDGSETEAFDGTEMMKALHAVNQEQAAQITDLQTAFTALADVVKGIRTVAGQHSTMLKSLGTKVGEVGSQRAPRRSMLSIVEKMDTASPTSGDPGQPTPEQVMRKAESMAASGAVLGFGLEAIPRIQAYQMHGQLAPPDLLARFPQLLTPLSA